MTSKDPLHIIGPDAQRELFNRFTHAANGFATDAVLGAAVNVMVNALRQAYSTRAAAEIAFDELFGRSKSILVEHYDSLGRKRGIFPFDQNIVVPLFDARPKQ